MADQNTKNNEQPRTINYGLLLICILVFCFVAAGIYNPTLVWPFSVVFCICAVLIWAMSKPSLPVNQARELIITQSDFMGKNTAIYHAMADALQYPTYILDQNANVVYSNHTGSVTFGAIKNGDKIFIKFRQPALRQTIEEALLSEKPMRTDFNETVPNDRWFSVEVSPIPNGHTQNSMHRKLFLLGFHDLTEVKRTDQMRSDFIANASHELRTPLASLLGYLETIKGPARKDEKAIDRFTDVMLDQAYRMTRLVNDLLSLSRIEMKAHVRPSGVVNLNEIINSVIVSLESVSNQLGVAIEFEEMPNDVSVTGDRDELLQVFENLVENACKYGQEGKRVIVSAVVEANVSEPSVDVSIQDFGPGIALEDQSRITERFYRVDVARSREKQGTGLGLAIVKHILNRHGTRIIIKSRPGEGAVFSVRLPLADVSVDKNNQ